MMVSKVDKYHVLKAAIEKIHFLNFLMLLFLNSLYAQVNIQNNGVLFISTTYDTLFVNGAFTNASGAGLNNNGNVYVKQDITNNQAALPAGTGTLYLNGTSLQNVGGVERLNTHNFVIDNNAGVALSNDMSVRQTFTLSNGNFALNSNFVTLLSDVTNTANVAPIGAAPSISYGTGKFIIERFILAHRSWRLLTAPISVTGSSTINSQWQEGQTSGNLIPGYGTHIAGGNASNGFDNGINSNANLKEYIAETWARVANTNATLITNKSGYMLFVRGDRSINLSQGIYAIPTTTVLRTRGQLKTGDQSYNVAGSGFTVIGNPYASPINLDQISKSNSVNIQDNYYLWDPKITGSNGVGGYVNVSWNGFEYDITPASGGSGLTQYIQSGSAFLARALDGTPNNTLVIKETDKSSTASINANRTANSITSLRSDLYSINTDGTVSIVDGILNSYDAMYASDIDNYDAIKLENISESLSGKRQGKLFVTERRQPINSADTIFLSMLHMKVKYYKFEFKTDNFSNNGLTGFLEDSYLNTNTPLNMNGTTTYNFNVINIPGSWNPNRFRIVFKQLNALPVTFTHVKAFAINKNIRVEWNAENEINITQYVIERSNDGQHFVQVKSVTATTHNNHISAYNWLDENVFEGNNYYRIKSIGINGDIKYSTIMKVYIGTDIPEIELTTNVITNNSVIFKMNSMPRGMYSINLVNNLGQVMYSKKINRENGSSTENIRLTKNFITGIYHLNIIKPDYTTITLKLLIK
jgi:predicted RNase H-related nuclease YkuK (DUF458 family)